MIYEIDKVKERMRKAIVSTIFVLLIFLIPLVLDGYSVSSISKLCSAIVLIHFFGPLLPAFIRQYKRVFNSELKDDQSDARFITKEGR